MNQHTMPTAPELINSLLNTQSNTCGNTISLMLFKTVIDFDKFKTQHSHFTFYVYISVSKQLPV